MLAALSPASSNYEETLSTIKYASRAKSIKVKAIKNEESSQISRLNDEIRSLKEKLAQQEGGDGPIGSGGGSDIGNNAILEDKAQQQLRELEEAMKSTWETKNKLSKEYEEERKRLLFEQQMASQQLKDTKARQWVLLEEKSNVEMTIAHLKEIIRTALTSLSEQRKEVEGVGDAILEEIEKWNNYLTKLTGFEKASLDQCTVIQIFKNAIIKDCETVKKVNPFVFVLLSFFYVPFSLPSVLRFGLANRLS
jgi:flagellar motility protein MotE (MotC chaperone)